MLGRNKADRWTLWPLEGVVVSYLLGQSEFFPVCVGRDSCWIFIIRLLQSQQFVDLWQKLLSIGHTDVFIIIYISKIHVFSFMHIDYNIPVYVYIPTRTKGFTNLERTALVEPSHFLSHDVLKSHKIYACKIGNINWYYSSLNKCDSTNWFCVIQS